MNNPVKRRTFLGLMAGVVLAALDFMYPGISTAAEIGQPGNRSFSPVLSDGSGVAVQMMEGPDPGFAGGEVVAKLPDGVVLQSASTVRAVRIPVDTVVWKEYEVTPEAIQLHDWVHVRGTPQSDGSLLAQSGWIWVNIGRVEGVIEQTPTGEGTLLLRSLRSQQSFTIELSKGLEIISAQDGTPLEGHLAALKPGSAVGAVGLRLSGGAFRATRIWM